MALKLVDGDYVPDGAGGLVRAGGAEELLQRIRFRLCARRGAFPFAPELGSELHLLGREKQSARLSAARQYVAEALADETEVGVTDVELTRGGESELLHITLTYEGEELTLALPVEGE